MQVFLEYVAQYVAQSTQTISYFQNKATQVCQSNMSSSNSLAKTVIKGMIQDLQTFRFCNIPLFIIIN